MISTAGMLSVKILISTSIIKLRYIGQLGHLHSLFGHTISSISNGDVPGHYQVAMKQMMLSFAVAATTGALFTPQFIMKTELSWVVKMEQLASED